MLIQIRGLAITADSRIVERYVYPAQPFQGLLNHPVDLVLVTHITCYIGGAIVVALLQQGQCRLFIDIADHYPRAFSVAMAGCGVKGGQVIGKTDASGASVTDHPVTVSDLFRTICSGLKVDADHENMSSIGRPIKIVEEGKVVKKVFA